MKLPRRVLLLAVICALCIAGATVYLFSSRAKHERAVQNAPTVSVTDPGAIEGKPRIVFRSTALGTKYGMVAMVPLDDPAGPRAFTTTSCDRVYATPADVLCLSSKSGITTTYAANVLDDRTMKSTQSLPLSGIPSRARLSTDGKLAATTSFVSGDSYAGASFSTRTVITRVGGGSSLDLEQFTLLHNGKSLKPVDRNFWGVTFAADDNTFYATALWSGHTWLVRGDLAKRQLVTLHEDVECPSISPDGTRIAYKQRGSLPAGHWHLAVYDLRAGSVTLLAESRNVDDQVEWLDNSHIIYGIPRSGSQAAVDDVWSVPADGTGQPALLIPQAWSPAVVR